MSCACELSSSTDQTAVKHAENSQTIFIFLPNCFGLLAITVTAAIRSPGRCQQQDSLILITIHYSEKARYVKTVVVPSSTLSHGVVQVVTMAGLPAGCCRLCIDLTTELWFVVRIITPVSWPGHTLSPVTYIPHPRTLLAVRRSLVVWSGVELKLGRVKSDRMENSLCRTRTLYGVCWRCHVTLCVFKCVVLVYVCI